MKLYLTFDNLIYFSIIPLGFKKGYCFFCMSNIIWEYMLKAYK